METNNKSQIINLSKSDEITLLDKLEELEVILHPFNNEKNQHFLDYLPESLKNLTLTDKLNNCYPLILTNLPKSIEYLDIKVESLLKLGNCSLKYLSLSIVSMNGCEFENIFIEELNIRAVMSLEIHYKIFEKVKKLKFIKNFSFNITPVSFEIFLNDFKEYRELFKDISYKSEDILIQNDLKMGKHFESYIKITLIKL